MYSADELRGISEKFYIDQKRIYEGKAFDYLSKLDNQIVETAKTGNTNYQMPYDMAVEFNKFPSEVKEIIFNSLSKRGFSYSFGGSFNSISWTKR